MSERNQNLRESYQNLRHKGFTQKDALSQIATLTGMNENTIRGIVNRKLEPTVGTGDVQVTVTEQKEEPLKFFALADEMVDTESDINEITSRRLVDMLDGEPKSELQQILDRLSDIESKINAPFVHTPKRDPKVELSKDITTEFFLSDVHWHPEHSEGHDPAAWAVCEAAIKDAQPDIIVWGGDVLDCYAPSRYEGTPRLKTPEAYDGEIAYGKQKLKEVRELAPNAKWFWITGNHEERVAKSIFSNAPWLMNKLQNVEKDLDLHEFDCKLVEDEFQIGKLKHYHGHKLAGSGRANIAKTKFERLLDNFIFGHHHKFCEWYQRRAEGGYYGAFGNGTFQWLETGYAYRPDWTQGFSAVQYTKSGLFQVTQIPIHKPSIWSPKAEAIYAGTHYKVDLS